MFDAVAGRFLGRDPILLRDTLNLYLFVMGKPLIGKDPTGRLAMFPACCTFSRVCKQDSLLMQACKLFIWTEEMRTETLESVKACKVPLDESGNPRLMPDGTVALNPNTCCKKNVPKTRNWFCTDYVVADAKVCSVDQFDTDCKRDLQEWLLHAGDGKGSRGHLACLAWCEKCVAPNGGLPGTPGYGHLKQICNDNICGNSFG